MLEVSWGSPIMDSWSLSKVLGNAVFCSFDMQTFKTDLDSNTVLWLDSFVILGKLLNLFELIWFSQVKWENY